MQDESHSIDEEIVASSFVKPARLEINEQKFREGEKDALGFYQLLIPTSYISDNINKGSFMPSELFKDQAGVYSGRALRVVKLSVSTQLGYSLSPEDEEKINNEVLRKYPEDTEKLLDFRLTTVDVLAAVLDAANKVTRLGVIKKAETDSKETALPFNDEIVRQQVASFFYGIAEGISAKLTSGEDAITEAARINEIKSIVDAQTDADIKRQGEERIAPIEYGLRLRKEASDRFHQLAGKMWK